MDSSVVVPLSRQPAIDAAQVQRNSCATAHVSRAIREVPSAMASVFHALGTMQKGLKHSEFVVYAKGGLCLVLAAMAVSKCMGECEESMQINAFLSTQMSIGVLSPSDVDTTIMKRCDVQEGDAAMLMGIPDGDDVKVTSAAKLAIVGLNNGLSKNQAFWEALDDILWRARYPFMDRCSESMDTEIYPCDENGAEGGETMFARIVSTKSRTPPLLRSLNSTLKTIAGFTLVRSKLHMFEETFRDCQDPDVTGEEETWFDASEGNSESEVNTNAVAEILDISWKDGEKYGCKMDMGDLMPLQVIVGDSLPHHEIFMMTIPALVKDLLFCLMSTPEQKSTKRVLRMALACAIANDDLSKAVREYLESPKDDIPEGFLKVFDFGNDAIKKTTFIKMIKQFPGGEIQAYIAQGTFIQRCMQEANKNCLNNGLIINFINNDIDVSPLAIGVGSSITGGTSGLPKRGDSGNNLGWSSAASAAAALAVTVASSFAGALRSR